MRKFFQCENALSENQLLASFKYKMLTILIVMLIISSVVFSLYFTLGFSLIANNEHYLRYTHALVGLLFFIILRYSKKSYAFVSYGLVVTTLGLFSYELIYSSSHEIAMLWFVVITVAAFISNGIKLGVTTALLSVFVLVVIKSTYNINVNNFTLLTVIASLFIISLMLFYFTKKIDNFSHDLVEQNCRLERLASSDALTGIMNRRVFLEIAKKYLFQARRGDEHFYFFMLDIDHFKSINDSYGHKEGDRVLITFAEHIEAILRENDLFGRLGGEEFGVVILEKDDKAALLVAEKIRIAIEAKVHEIEGKVLPVTASIGVSLNCVECSLEEVMHHADEAMYEAKKLGRNRVSFKEVA